MNSRLLTARSPGAAASLGLLLSPLATTVDLVTHVPSLFVMIALPFVMIALPFWLLIGATSCRVHSLVHPREDRGSDRVSLRTATLHVCVSQTQTFRGQLVSIDKGASVCRVQGTEGTLYIDRGRYEVIPDRGKKEPKASALILGTGEKGLDFYDKPDGELLHLTNWIECIRDRSKKVACPAETGVSAASPHLANQSVRSGQVAVWKG